MAKRRVTVIKDADVDTDVPSSSDLRVNSKDLRELLNQALNFIWITYQNLNGKYLTIATIAAITILSFLIPNVPQKIHTTVELKQMKEDLTKMTSEVSRAEAECLTAAREICYLLSSMKGDSANTNRISKENVRTYRGASVEIPNPPHGNIDLNSHVSKETPKNTQSCPAYTQTRELLHNH